MLPDGEAGVVDCKPRCHICGVHIEVPADNGGMPRVYGALYDAGRELVCVLCVLDVAVYREKRNLAEVLEVQVDASSTSGGPVVLW